jgi:hypothetical protein
MYPPLACLAFHCISLKSINMTRLPELNNCFRETITFLPSIAYVTLRIIQLLLHRFSSSISGIIFHEPISPEDTFDSNGKLACGRLPSFFFLVFL